MQPQLNPVLAGFSSMHDPLNLFFPGTAAQGLLVDVLQALMSAQSTQEVGGAINHDTATSTRYNPS